MKYIHSTFVDLLSSAFSELNPIGTPYEYVRVVKWIHHDTFYPCKEKDDTYID